ncbi:hypothetical protein IFM89_029772 [Coptis chinensis]|uniref:Protein PLANT CADMIUM RESISTANCE 8 n=1 Tax=Coptis chinensis TaxID=261450 RepID=A0A835ICM4_9MAGN|nr:hypothetical protein IFM89_029772 [Coptis chinensis]
MGENDIPGNEMAQNQIGEPWKTGLFDCQLNQNNAIMTAFLPCVTHGQIAEILDGGETTCPLGSFIYLLMMPALCSQWIMGSKYRTKLRKKYNLVEAPYEDCASHVLCPCCSLCQEFRELQSRGLDPTLGWNGILAQQAMQQRNQDQVQQPPLNQTMFMNNTATAARNKASMTSIVDYELKLDLNPCLSDLGFKVSTSFTVIKILL